MSTHVIGRVGSPVARLSLRAQHGTWLGAGLALGFLFSFVFADLLDLPRDLYLRDLRGVRGDVLHRLGARAAASRVPH